MALVVVEALERERRLLLAKLRVLRRRLKGFEERYGMEPGEFLERFESGELGDEEDYMVWWSLLRALRSVEERLKRVEEELQKLR